MDTERSRRDAVDCWPMRRVGTALGATAAIALAVGVPTGLVPSPLYTRMTPVLWWNYVIWAATAVLGGLLVATYVRRPGDRAARNGAGAASGGGLLAAFAVGCPVCNKLVVAVLGVSGAMTFWAPLQPLLGVLSVLGLAWALRRRSRNEYACSVTAQPAPTATADTGTPGLWPPPGTTLPTTLSGVADGLGDPWGPDVHRGR